MTRIIYFLLISLVALVSFSCEDNFEPKAAFSEKYVLNCIFNADSLVHLASLSRTYDVDGYNPLTNNVDPSITNALIYVNYKGVTYQMHDTTVARTDTSRYTGPMHVYSISSFVPLANDSIEIIAVPKEGITLRAKTKIPSKINIVSSTSAIILENTDLKFSWPIRDQDIYYIARLRIFYTKRNETPGRTYSVEVPVLIDVNGKSYYPQVSKSPDVYYYPDVIDKTMLKISENDNKINYKFLKLELEVKMFDEFLSNYISSTNVFNDEISIRLDEPNFTNIDGGFGVVGSSIKSRRSVILSQDYLFALGYTP